MGATCARGPRAAQVRAAARAQRKRTSPAISLSFQPEQWKSAVLSAPLAVILSFKKLRPFRGEVCYLSASEVDPRSYFLLIVGLIPIWRKWLFSAVARADEQRLCDADRWLFLITVKTLKTPFCPRFTVLSFFKNYIFKPSHSLPQMIPSTTGLFARAGEPETEAGLDKNAAKFTKFTFYLHFSMLLSFGDFFLSQKILNYFCCIKKIQFLFSPPAYVCAPCVYLVCVCTRLHSE